MAIEPRQIAGMMEQAMGPGGPAAVPEDAMTEVQIPLPGMEDLPPGIEIAGMEETVEVEAEVYDHNANLAEVLDQSTLGSLSSDLGSLVDEDREGRSEWEEAISKGLTLLGINYDER